MSERILMDAEQWFEQKASARSQAAYEEAPVLVDVSSAANSAQACQMVESFLTNSSVTGKSVDILAGHVLLTRNVLSKIHQQFIKNGLTVKTVFTSVPQTQQAALDEGFFVKESTQVKSFRTRMDIPYERAGMVKPPADGVDIPQFQNRGKLEAKVVDSIDEAMMDMLARKSAPEETASEESASEPEELVREEIVLESYVDSLEIIEKDSETHVLGEQIAASQSSVEEQHVPKKIVKRTSAVNEMEGISDEIDVQEVIRPRVREIAYDPTQSTISQMDDEVESTFLYKQTLRSGQVLRYDGSIVILGDVHAGSEVIAGGDVIVWGELKGIAHAGYNGNNFAEVRAMKVEAIQLRIGDFIARRPDRIYNHKLTESPFPKPEVARVADGEIKIFTELVH